jgi:hypothetical protein
MSCLSDYHPAVQSFYKSHSNLFHEKEFDNEPAVFSQLGKFKLEHKFVLPLKDLAREGTPDLPANYMDVIPKPQYLKIDKEEEWNQNNNFVDGACDAIEKHRKVLIEGIAGYGKSKLVEFFLNKHSDQQHLVLNFCGSLITDVWGGFNAKTVDSALGGRFNAETNSIDTVGNGINFSTVDILVIDECYMVNLGNLFKIQQKIKNENPKMVVIYMGDPRQNQLIVKHAEKHVRSILESQEEIFAKLAPTRIELKVNKRSPQDQSKIETIDKMLFQEKQSQQAVLDYIIKHKWVNTVSSFEEICDLGIDTHVCYWSKKPVALGEAINRYYDQPASHQIYTGKYFLKRNYFGRQMGSHCEVKVVNNDSLIVTFDNGTVAKSYDEILASVSDLNAPCLKTIISILFERIGVYRCRCNVKGLTMNELVCLVSSKKNEHLFVPLCDLDAKPVKLTSICGAI